MSDAAVLTHADDSHGHAEAHVEHPTATGIETKKLLMWLFLASDCMFFGTLISTHLVYRKVYPYGSNEKGIIDILKTFDIQLTSFSTFILLMSSFLMALAVSAMHKGQIKSFRRACIGVMVFGLIFLTGQVYEFTHFFDGHALYTFSVKTAAGETISSTYEGPSDQARAKADLARRLFRDHPDWMAVPATATTDDKALAPADQMKRHPDWIVPAMKQVKVEKPSLSMQNSVFGSTFFLMTGTHGCHVAIGVLWLASMYLYSFTGRMQKNMHGAAIDIEICGLYWHFVDIVWIVIFTAVYLVEYIPGYNPVQ
jgi:cytochrome o ubiquinol oxidase subunit 3